MPFVRRWPVALCGVLAIAALSLGIAETAWPSMADDAFIALRYAERFVHGQGLTWTDGERVEGYSILLWILASAALIALGVDGVTAVRILGFGCTVATIVVLVTSRMIPPALGARLAVVVFASLGCTTTWATAGLEGPLVLLLLAIAWTNVGRLLGDEACAARASKRAGVAFALLALTRSDAPLWIAAAAFVVLSQGRRGAVSIAAAMRMRLFWLLLLPAAAIAAQLLCRLGYYGDWLPNTAYAKLFTTTTTREAGLAYIASNAAAMRALLLPALLALPALFVRDTQFVVLLAGLGTAAWWLYVLLIGGDAFPRGRFLIASLVPLTVLAAHGLNWLAARGRAGPWVAAAAAIACVGLAHHDARHAGTDPLQQLSTREWYGKPAGEWLGRAFGEARPLLAVDAAGFVPYFSRLPCLDMLGLCDRTIARTPYPAEAAFIAGHSRANAPYVLSRRPDLVMFGLPPGAPMPQWLGGRQMEADPEFLANYRLVLFDVGPSPLPTGETKPVRIIVWARLPGRLGLRPDPAAPANMLLPGFWLGCYRQPYSFVRAAAEPEHFDREQLARDLRAGAARLLDPVVLAVAATEPGMPVASVRRAGRHLVPSLPLVPGRYRIRGPDLPAGVQLALQGPDGAALVDGADAFRVAGTTATVATDLVCDVPANVAVPFVVAHFVLERIE